MADLSDGLRVVVRRAYDGIPALSCLCCMRVIFVCVSPVVVDPPENFFTEGLVRSPETQHSAPRRLSSFESEDKKYKTR